MLRCCAATRAAICLAVIGVVTDETTGSCPLRARWLMFSNCICWPGCPVFTVNGVAARMLCWPKPFIPEVTIWAAVWQSTLEPPLRCILPYNLPIGKESRLDPPTLVWGLASTTVWVVVWEFAPSILAAALPTVAVPETPGVVPAFPTAFKEFNWLPPAPAFDTGTDTNKLVVWWWPVLPPAAALFAAFSTLAADDPVDGAEDSDSDIGWANPGIWTCKKHVQNSC